MKRIIGMVGIVAGVALGCADKLDPKPAKGQGDAGDDESEVADSTAVEEEEEEEGVRYSSEVRPILEAYCVDCHSSERAGSIARNSAPDGVDYDTYEGAVENAEAGNARIQADTMPPSGDGLSDEEKQLFQAWIDAGLGE